jgi:hypothetical protein
MVQRLEANDVRAYKNKRVVATGLEPVTIAL